MDNDTTPQDPEWLSVGAKVAIYTPGRFSDTTGHLVPTTVARITKRDVVLSSGDRFPRRNLRKPGPSDWAPGSELLSADDPIVAQTSRANRIQRSERAVVAAADEFRKAPSGQAADSIVAAVEAWRQASRF